MIVATADAATGLDEAMTYVSRGSGTARTPVSLGADGRPLTDPNSKHNAAYSDLSFSDRCVPMSAVPD